MKIVEHITRECKRKKLTIAELERNAGLSNGTIKKWESSMPKVDSLGKVAEYLRVSLDYLCSDEEQSNSNINESELLFYYNNLSVNGKNLCLEYIKGFSNAESHYKPLVNSDNPICYPDKFEIDTFFSNSEAEQKTYEILNEIVNTEYYTIIPHVSLSDLFHYKKENVESMLNIYKLLGYHVDFAFFDKKFHPVLAIEINGSKHYKNSKTIWTDNQKQAFFAYHHIPLISADWSKPISNEKDYWIDKLDHVSLPVYCWKCKNLMELKENTKEKNLFYACYQLTEHLNHKSHTVSIEKIPTLLRNS